MSKMKSGAVVKTRKLRTLRRRDGLIAHARDVTSQNGEDGIIARLFELLPDPQHGPRWLVDVGAWDGKHLSNTHSLLTNGHAGTSPHAWRGVLIEADPSRFAELVRLHGAPGTPPPQQRNICVCRSVSCAAESPDALPAILASAAPELPRDFDFLCVDVDGTDYWLVAALLRRDAAGEMHGTGSGTDSADAKAAGVGDVAAAVDGRTPAVYRPKVVCVEFNPTIPDDVIFVQARDDGVRHGSSLAALVELLHGAGYTLVETTVFNAFFVTNELYSNYLHSHVPDTSIEALHETSMGTRLYQLYDGTLKLAGCRKLLWHRRPIREEDIQALPAEQRHFPFAPPPPS